LSAFERTLK